MYHLYIVENSKGRVGFGIAKDYVERNQFYCGHAGDILKFPVVYGGLRSHAKALEKTIKTELYDEIWTIEKESKDWKTEWLVEGKDRKFLESYINDLIKDRHIKLKIITRNYDFTQE
jgi:predicted GIY-YIG superfamily endonuclease